MHSFDPQVLKYLPPERIAHHLAKLHPGMVVTHGRHQSLVPGYIRDLEWNFYDEIHRLHVHNTYHDMYKVMTGRYFSVNVVKWKNLPFFIQVANAKIADGLFYQSMTILGILLLHQVQRISQKDEQVLLEVDWYIASHWIFRWLHRPFNRRLLKLQRQQDLEDNTQIRGRRFALRQRGINFATDDADFINSNILTDNVRLAALATPARIELGDYVEGPFHHVAVGQVELILRRRDDGKVDLWPGLCPHEGARLEERHICAEEIVCPWHGRRFSMITLGERGRWRFLSLTITR
jgi:hypothetical protein